MKKKESKRIAQIIGKMCAGGVEAVVFNYYREINKDEVQFDFYYDADSTIEPPQELLDMGARFIKNPPYQKIWKYIPFLIKSFKENRYRVVHSHLNTLSVFPLFAATMAKCPIRIAHNHSVPGNDNFLRNLLKVTLKNFSKCFATHYFACSERAGRWLFGDKEFESGNVVVIRNAINFKKFEVAESYKDELTNELNLKDKFVIGHVGRFTAAKNHKFLLEVFSCIKKNKENAVLLLVGDGELRDEIDEIINRKQLADSVIFVGKTMNPEKYYPLMDVIVFPSFFEGLPMVTIEAQISGVPIIVSSVVPDETNISSGWKKMSLDQAAEEWASEAVKIAETEIDLSVEKSKHYNIELEVDNLLDRYKKLI